MSQSMHYFSACDKSNLAGYDFITYIADSQLSAMNQLRPRVKESCFINYVVWKNRGKLPTYLSGSLVKRTERVSENKTITYVALKSMKYLCIDSPAYARDIAEFCKVMLHSDAHEIQRLLNQFPLPTAYATNKYLCQRAL